ncbi:hypothetical protein DPEC_G00094860 [Dallia pectoralis]|uniref:Uncharacterized protein n=1 Tax=Dallia pectoralis TaxID=75939 RepID=A0ACC2H1B6_DALPE|nr:hypothetical protein DPEC_G00094860 [Dallia pectoralis]
METVVLDTDSEDEISGSSMMLSGNSVRNEPVKGTVIILSDEEEEEEEVEIKNTLPKNVTQLPQNLLGSQDSGCKRRLSACESSQGGEASNCVKKPAVQEDSVTDDSENEGSEPSWRSQENMVRKLQDKFPHLVKEELREVLLKHDWQLEDTLEALRMFSEEVETPSQVDIPASSSASSAPKPQRVRRRQTLPVAAHHHLTGQSMGPGSTSMNRLTNKRRWIPERAPALRTCPVMTWSLSPRA